ncbi:MAG TPA: hypothetical protein DIW45_00285, partial [Erythrobacter sp.]|nr:hypothetical protein [Erythrobacter sp.]
TATIFASLAAGGLAVLRWRNRDGRDYLRASVIAVSLALVAGLALVWVRSAMVGAEPIPHPRFERIDARILER